MKVYTRSDDSHLVNQLLTTLPYPLSKVDLLKELQVIGADEAVLALIEQLSRTTFNSAREARALLAEREGSAA